MQGALQDLLEEEVSELLGRLKSERCKLVDGVRGYRNGYGNPRNLTRDCGTVTVRRPRVKDLQERFVHLRGLPAPRLAIGDGHLGLWGGLRNVYPEADEQRCWNHRTHSVLDKLPKKQRAAALEMLKKLPSAETGKEAEKPRPVSSGGAGKRDSLGRSRCSIWKTGPQEESRKGAA